MNGNLANKKKQNKRVRTRVKKKIILKNAKESTSIVYILNIQFLSILDICQYKVNHVD